MQTPVVQVAQLLYWQQYPPTHLADVHWPAAVHVAPFAFFGKHWPLLR